MRKIILIIILVIALVGCSEEVNNVAEVNDEVVTTEGEVENNVVETEDTQENDEVTENTSENVVEINRFIVAVDALNVRKEPSVDSEKIDSAFLGSVYDIVSEHLDEENDELWYEINLENGTTGWLAGWFCEPTDRELIRYERDECLKLNVNPYYLLGYSPKIEDIIGNSEMILYVDGEEITDDESLMKLGKHEIYGVFDFNGFDRKTIPYTYSVLNDHVKRAYRETMDESAPIIAFHTDLYDFRANLNCLWLFEEDGLQAWFEVQIDEDTLGYAPYFESEFSIFETIKVKTNEGVIEYTGENQSFLDGLFGDRYIQVIGEEYHLINPENGKTANFDNEIIITENGTIAMTYPSTGTYYEDKNKQFTVKLVDLSSGNLEVLFEHDKTYAYIYHKTDGIPEIIDGKTFILGNEETNDWQNANDQIRESEMNIQHVNGVWEVNIKEESDVINEDENILVYESLGSNSAQLGFYNTSDCESITFTNTFDIINDEYVLWFEVELSDGRKGFAYRGNRNLDEIKVSIEEEFYLLKSDGSLVTIKSNPGLLAKYHILEDLYIRQGYYTVSIYNEGSYSRCIPKDINKETFEEIDTFSYWVFDTPYMLKYQELYAGSEIKLSILDLDTMKTVFEYEHEWITITDINIIDSSNISFIIDAGESKYLSTLQYINGKWELITDFSER